MNVVEKNLSLKTIFNFPLVEGKVTFDELDNLNDEIIQRKNEIFPGSTTAENYDYIKSVWYDSYDYICINVFPQLKSLFPIIAESLELVNDNYNDYFFKSWINIWPKGQTINPHRHTGTWVGNFIINDTGTETYYADADEPTKRSIVPLENFNGHFAFMPAHILHWGQKNMKEELRVGYAFNLATWEQVLEEDNLDQHDRKGKVKKVYVPLKDYV